MSSHWVLGTSGELKGFRCRFRAVPVDPLDRNKPIGEERTVSVSEIAVSLFVGRR